MRITRPVLCGFLIAAIAFARSATAVAQTPEPIPLGETLDRAGLVRAVLDRNPTVEAARLAWRGAVERVAASAALEQPTLSYGFAPLSVGSSSIVFGQEIELSQRLARGGTRRLERSIAEAEAASLASDLAAARLELARTAALLFVDYILVSEVLDVNARHVELLAELQRSATARYAAGLGSQQDPLQAESELAEMLGRGVRLRSEERIVASRINTLLHRAPEAPLPPAREVLAPARALDHSGARAAGDLSTPSTHGTDRPELQSLRSSLDAKRGELELARRAGRPEPMMMASYNSMWSDQEHRFMVGAEWSVPLWRAQLRAGVAAAAQDVARVEAELSAKEREIEAVAWQASQRVRAAEHVLSLLESRMLPASHDRAQAALAGYSAGTNDFAVVIEAERALRDAELEHRRAMAELEQQTIELEYATGRLIDPSPSPAPEQTIGDEP